MKLTARSLDTLRPDATRRLEVPDDEVSGLAIRVTPQGSKSWTLRYRLAGGRSGRLRRLTLGAYPAVGLVDARKAARKALGHVAVSGTDPAAAKQAARLGETVADLAQEYLKLHAKPRMRSWREDERMLDADVLPAWKTRKVKDLTRRDVRDLVEAIAERGAPITANRCLALVRESFGRCSARSSALSGAAGRGGNTDRIRARRNAGSGASRRNARRSVPCSRLATRHRSQACDSC